MQKRFIQTTMLFAALIGCSALSVLFIIHSCSPNQLSQEDVEPKETTITVQTDVCGSLNAVEFSVAHCVQDGEFDMWQGYADECFNLGCQTSWTPALGIMCIRCTWPICAENFAWRRNDYCQVPSEYLWEVSPTYDPQQGQFWEGKLTFEPNECLAEEVNNCHYFTIYGYACPY
jgi:hypothetical protein